MMVKILKKKTGNCGCAYCNERQPGWKSQPYTVWHKFEHETHGHNEPVCSIECATLYAKYIGGDVYGI